MQVTAKNLQMLASRLAERIAGNIRIENEAQIIPAPVHAMPFLKDSVNLLGDSTQKVGRLKNQG